MDKIDIAENVRRELVGKGLTLALAESCTGGALAACLTAVPGSSHYFLGSLVCYSNALKQSVLGVSEETLRKYGAVSEQTVREMVLGGLRLTGSDFAIANTGVAGPGGGTEEKPVGTVWMAIARKEGKVISWSLCYKGTRQEVIRQTVDTLLEALLLQVT